MQCYFDCAQQPCGLRKAILWTALGNLADYVKQPCGLRKATLQQPRIPEPVEGSGRKCKSRKLKCSVTSTALSNPADCAWQFCGLRKAMLQTA